MAQHDGPGAGTGAEPMHTDGTAGSERDPIVHVDLPRVQSGDLT
jgi:hypothetical protein